MTKFEGHFKGQGGKEENYYQNCLISQKDWSHHIEEIKTKYDRDLEVIMNDTSSTMDKIYLFYYEAGHRTIAELINWIKTN